MTAHVDGRAHVEARGPRDAASCLVLLHGLGSSSADWEAHVPAFAERHRVLLLDLPGHGRSPLAPRRLTVDDMASVVEHTLGAEGAPPAHVVGLSLGGCVALALALRTPARVRSLTLVNAFARLRPQGPRAAIRMLTRLALIGGAPMTVVAAHVARGLFPRPEQRELYRAAVASLARTPRRAYLAATLAVAGFDARGRLGEIACPTLVVAGAEDRTVPLAAKQVLANAIPGARLIVVPGSGHATPHDQPRAFARAVLDFIDAPTH